MIIKVERDGLPVPQTGSPQGAIHFKERDRCGMETGRATTRALPSTSSPRSPLRYYTTNRPARPCIVGAGEDVDVGMGPLWLPVRALHLSFLVEMHCPQGPCLRVPQTGCYITSVN